MDYTFQAVSLSVALQLRPVDIRQGTLFASDTLSLSIALSDVTLRLNRAFLAAPLTIGVGLPAVSYRRGASTWAVAPLEPRLRLGRVNLAYASFYEIPQVFPSTREFNPPAYPITQARTQSGTVKQRIWASRPGGGSLKLGFTNISDSDAEGLAKIWDRAKGKRLSVVLPRRLFRGMDPALQAHLELRGLPLTWVFARQPSPRSVFPGVSSIDLEFVARGYGGQALPVVTVPDPPREWFVGQLLLSMVLRSASLRALRIARLASIDLDLEAQELRILLNRRAVVSSLALSIALNDATLKRVKALPLAPLELNLDLSSVGLLALRIAGISSLQVNLSLPSAGFNRVRIVAVSSLAINLGLSDVLVQYEGRPSFLVEPLVITPSLPVTGFNRVSPEDPLFSSVVWLVPFDGVAGGTFFADRSSYWRANTTVGNVQASVAQVRAGASSGLFDGSGDRITTANNTAELNLTGDYTIEAWIYPTVLKDSCILSSSAATPTNIQIFRITAGGVLQIYLQNSEGGPVSFASSGQVIFANQWTHLALTRSGTTTRLFVNGSIVATNTAWTFGLRVDVIGTLLANGGVPTGSDFQGYIDDVRVTRAARYTAAFTPPVAAFPFITRFYEPITVGTIAPAIQSPQAGMYAPLRFEPMEPFWANVTWLVPFDGTDGGINFRDRSSFARATTRSGDARISAVQSRFGSTSGFFDGNGDWIGATPSTDLQFPGDFTIECWIYPTGTGEYVIGSSSSDSNTQIFRLNHGGNVGQMSVFLNGTSVLANTAAGITANTWQHLAMTRSGSTVRIFRNGVQVGGNITYSGTFRCDKIGMLFISGSPSLYPYLGYIDDFRVTRGVSRYNSNFAVVPAPAWYPLATYDSFAVTPLAVTPQLANAFMLAPSRFENVDPFFSNVALLAPLNGANNSTIYNDYSQNELPITRLVNSFISTSQSRFNGSSMSVDGNLGGLYVQSNVLIATGNWTFEAWIYPTRTSSYNCIFQNDAGGAEQLRLYVWNGALMVRHSGIDRFNIPGVNINQWNHVALVRSGGVYRAYLNGTRSAGSYSLAAATLNAFRIGADSFNNQGLLGFMQDVRITIGVARYTDSSFTVPTSPHPRPVRRVTFVPSALTAGSLVLRSTGFSAPPRFP